MAFCRWTQELCSFFSAVRGSAWTGSYAREWTSTPAKVHSILSNWDIQYNVISLWCVQIFIFLRTVTDALPDSTRSKESWMLSRKPFTNSQILLLTVDELCHSSSDVCSRVAVYSLSLNNWRLTRRNTTRSYSSLPVRWCRVDWG